MYIHHIFFILLLQKMSLERYKRSFKLVNKYSTIKTF